jgi:hypothetical protein
MHVWCNNFEVHFERCKKIFFGVPLTFSITDSPLEKFVPRRRLLNRSVKYFEISNVNHLFTGNEIAHLGYDFSFFLF